MNSPQRALEDANLAIQMDPTYSKAYHRLAFALEGLGKKAEARSAMQKLRELEAAAKGGGAAGKADAAAGKADTAAEKWFKGDGTKPATPATAPAKPATAPSTAPLTPESLGASLPEDERVTLLLHRLRPTTAGSEERKLIVAALLALLETVTESGSKQVQKATARAFVDAEGPELLYSMESSMGGNWMADAKNGACRV